ncbi:LysR family transcriptional regulator [Pseudomonas gingeri NCPPB 3146 = LMG 5327]|uniref:LysR family transcriptional regulator n=2 Tax=Pseudomonas gingeri TaxID=117681 RepID=A0A7Y7Y6X4_9PSED|nr:MULTISPECIES: LysR substrate-binding domain-containing protein [Pseudomonas]NWC17767.1 LysR family transcriptional regulator [Pseudomonas gingeri]NWE48346.1 LysR family transcriptional regulator [Pseudomonas gingeri]NWE69101.1 LysR family transcriptional regulator [Pseudomonas gingeri]PNQ92596.1 LysR family transcriptional regulator [Pseudomonas gingeri NCPPB 3146 = LMG 5327]BBP76262.1 transcriptional regulator [Pseudomonas sp. Ost2]
MSNHRLPPLNAVRAFEAAARLGSYVSAAKELHVTQPAIGRHVKALEEYLGTSLFKRTPRGVLLTADGWRYFEQVSSALTQIADVSYEFTSRREQRWLRLLVVPGLAGQWLRHQLPEFRALHPGIRIALEPNASFRQISAERTDLGIAFGDPEDFEGATELLCQPAIFPVCAPDFLAQCPPLQVPKDLLNLTLLHEDDGYWWRHWFHSQGVKARLSSEMSYVSADQVIDLALSGAGVGLTNSLLVMDELEKGLLVRPIGHEARLEGYLLLSPPGGLKPEAKAFRLWLLEKLKNLSI